ncbi:MAG: hypothetical protein ACM3U1_06360 [Chloroflexota bacterium]
MKKKNVRILSFIAGFIMFIGLIFLFTIIASTPAPTIEDCLKRAKLSSVYNYKVKDTTIISAIGDYFESHEIIISRSDYRKLDSEIRAKPFFIEYDSLAIPKFAYGLDIDWSKTTESAFSQKGKTFYDRLDPKLGEVIRILLKDDSLLIVEYQNL